LFHIRLFYKKPLWPDNCFSFYRIKHYQKPLKGTTMKKILIAASFGLAIYLPQAEAEQFNFSYTDAADGIALAGIMNGTLEADNNTVAVTSVQDVTFNGAARIAPYRVVFVPTHQVICYHFTYKEGRPEKDRQFS
jgi:hypothetical protein